MESPDSYAVVVRFFQALSELKSRGVIRGKQTFTRRYGINRWNLNTVEKNPESGMFKVEWLVYLSRDFGVSAQWLLTGEGSIFLKNDNDQKKHAVPAGSGKIKTRRSASLSGSVV